MPRFKSTAKERGTGGFGRLATLLFLFLVSTTCSEIDPSATPASVGPVILTVGYPHITGEDPLHGIRQAARLVSFEGLTRLNREGRPLPRLAESWVESSDGLTWKISLRRNAFFHDNSKVDALAVKRSLEKSIASSDRDLTPGLADVLGIETPSEFEIVVRLRGRSTFLLDDFTVPIVKSGPKGSSLGTGAFVTTSTSSSEVVMSAVPNYYRGKPVIDRIVWKAYPAVRTAWAAMMRGEVDFLYEVAPDTLEFIEQESSVQVFSFLRNYVYVVGLNLDRGIFRNGHVRRALNYAIDRTTLVKQALKGQGRHANGPAWPLHWAYDANIPQFSFDPARAAALIDSAGIQKFASKRESGRAPARMHFTCLLPENFALWEKMALLVQRNLLEVGIDMQLESVPFGTFNQRIATKNYDAVLLELIVGNSISRPYFFWHSQGRLNAWGYRNPRVDSSLDGIRRAASDVEYRDEFRRFQTETLNDAPAIFLALSETTRAVSRRFRVEAPPGTDILPSIADWRLAEQTTRTTN